MRWAFTIALLALAALLAACESCIESRGLRPLELTVHAPPGVQPIRTSACDAQDPSSDCVAGSFLGSDGGALRFELELEPHGAQCNDIQQWVRVTAPGCPDTWVDLAPDGGGPLPDSAELDFAC